MFLENWETELDICSCKGECVCGAYRNTPPLELVKLLLKLKDKILT